MGDEFVSVFEFGGELCPICRNFDQFKDQLGNFEGTPKDTWKT